VRPDPPDLPPKPESADLEAMRVTEAEIEDASLAGVRRPGLALVDCVLRRCDLANLDARTASMRRVVVAGGRMTGALLSESRFEDVTFEDCRADLTGWALAELRRVRFASCDLRAADFQEARLKAVSFEDCDLREVDFDRTRFESVEMRRCRLDGARGVQSFSGVRMPWADIVDNAGAFAAACGIQTLDAP
jgi:uncharacterized protein YjbI with pentapeptide repeats